MCLIKSYGEYRVYLCKEEMQTHTDQIKDTLLLADGLVDSGRPSSCVYCNVCSGIEQSTIADVRGEKRKIKCFGEIARGTSGRVNKCGG